jgi:hypothetical protein
VDITDGSWTNELDSNVDLYASLDELSYNDADYCKSVTSPSNDMMEVKLSSMTDPETSLDHAISYRYGKESASGQIDIVVRLVQGTTVIATWTHTNVPVGWVTADQTLSAGEANAITDYADLRVRVEANAV